MTTPEAGPPDPRPSLAEVGRALETISESTARLADLIVQWESGNFAVGAEIVAAARRLAGP